MNIIISGVAGRMGQAVTALCAEQGIGITAGIDLHQPPLVNFPVFSSFSECGKGDCIIDFSKPQALTGLLAHAEAHGIPVVLATTGYSAEEQEYIRIAAEKIPVFQSANMSLGIALLKSLAQMAAMALDNFDIEIVETHHNKKADAPSGTALLLYDAIRDASRSPKRGVCGREGLTGERKAEEIGIHALRGGTVAGIHEVSFFGENEIITVSHTATNRRIFASGAVRAALFIQGKEKGLYTMDDLVAEHGSLSK